jgi:hypothetical protein
MGRGTQLGTTVDGETRGRQGRNHGLKVGGVQKFFFARGRAMSGRERRFKMVRKIFFPVLSYIYSNRRNQQKSTGFRSDKNLLGNIRGTY